MLACLLGFKQGCSFLTNHNNFVLKMISGKVETLCLFGHLLREYGFIRTGFQLIHISGLQSNMLGKGQMNNLLPQKNTYMHTNYTWIASSIHIHMYTHVPHCEYIYICISIYTYICNPEAYAHTIITYIHMYSYVHAYIPVTYIHVLTYIYTYTSIHV